jgi:hypothetical protein
MSGSEREDAMTVTALSREMPSGVRYRAVQDGRGDWWLWRGRLVEGEGVMFDTVAPLEIEGSPAVETMLAGRVLDLERELQETHEERDQARGDVDAIRTGRVLPHRGGGWSLPSSPYPQRVWFAQLDTALEYDRLGRVDSPSTPDVAPSEAPSDVR